MRKYDTTFIIAGHLGQNEREAIISRYSATIERVGGTIDRVVRWGMRTLAYEINRSNRGYYVILYYTAPPAGIKEIEREISLNENILRYMTLLFDGVHPSYINDESERPAGATAETVAETPEGTSVAEKSDEVETISLDSEESDEEATADEDDTDDAKEVD